MSDDQGEVRDAADPEETVLDHVEPSGDAETEFSPFDELGDAFRPGPTLRTTGADGLPVTMDQTTESDIPALSTETLVCMGDYHAFVVRSRWGEVIVSFKPAEVERSQDGRWRVKMPALIERSKLVIEQQRKHFSQLSGGSAELSDAQLFMSLYTEVGEYIWLDPDWHEVQPIRPPCRHYVRQESSFDLNAHATKFSRLCAARRTTEGTFMTVSDLGVWACDMRSPHDAATVRRLDEFDEKKIAEGKNRQHLPMFRSPLGIFDTQPVSQVTKE